MFSPGFWERYSISPRRPRSDAGAAFVESTFILTGLALALGVLLVSSLIPRYLTTRNDIRIDEAFTSMAGSKFPVQLLTMEGLTRQNDIVPGALQNTLQSTASRLQTQANTSDEVCSVAALFNVSGGVPSFVAVVDESNAAGDPCSAPLVGIPWVLFLVEIMESISTDIDRTNVIGMGSYVNRGGGNYRSSAHRVSSQAQSQF